MANNFKIGEVGETVITRGLAAALEKSEQLKEDLSNAWAQYVNCEWGILGEDDKQMNDSAVQNKDDRILARYKTTEGDIYIITEWDRSYTTFMFCDEY